MRILRLSTTILAACALALPAVIAPTNTHAGVVALSRNTTLRVQGTDSTGTYDRTDGTADFGAPDGLWFDQFGRLWVQTDQVGTATGDWVNIGANCMVCADPATGGSTSVPTAWCAPTRPRAPPSAS